MLPEKKKVFFASNYRAGKEGAANSSRGQLISVLEKEKGQKPHKQRFFY